MVVEPSATPPPRPDFTALRPRLAASLRGARMRATFSDIQAFCLFIGHPRSGHSMVGSLLDAHPDIVISHELDAMSALAGGYGRAALFASIIERAEVLAGTSSLRGGYQYHVAGQWQGRHRTLRVIGDKRGAGTTAAIDARPQVLDALRCTVRVPLRVVHIVRNPFDNIAAFHRIWSPSLSDTVDTYFQMCAALARQRPLLAEDELLSLRHEDFVAEPRGHLGRACTFLGVTAPGDYLDACAAIVLPEPRRGRHGVDWPADVRADIEARTAEYDFLDGYTFDD